MIREEDEMAEAVSECSTGDHEIRTEELVADVGAPTEFRSTEEGSAMEERIESCTMSPAESCVTIGLLVKNRPVRGLMDSGAKRSVIDIGTLETLDKDIRIDPIKDI